MATLLKGVGWMHYSSSSNALSLPTCPTDVRFPSLRLPWHCWTKSLIFFLLQLPGHPAVLSSLGPLKAWPCWSLQFWEASSHSFYKPPPIPVFLLPSGCSFYVSYGLSSPSSYLTHHQMLSVSQTWGLLTLFTLHTDAWTSHPLPLFVCMYNMCVCPNTDYFLSPDYRPNCLLDFSS